MIQGHTARSYCTFSSKGAASVGTQGPEAIETSSNRPETSFNRPKSSPKILKGLRPARKLPRNSVWRRKPLAVPGSVLSPGGPPAAPLTISHAYFGCGIGLSFAAGMHSRSTTTTSPRTRKIVPVVPRAFLCPSPKADRISIRGDSKNLLHLAELVTSSGLTGLEHT